MEGPHVQPAGQSLPHHRSDALLHLPRGFLGKSECQDPVRLAALVKDIGNPAGQHPCLARACSCNYQHRSVHTGYSFPLLTVQPLEYSIHFVLHNYRKITKKCVSSHRIS